MMIGIIIQARMDSTRLPGKATMQLEGKPVIQHIIERCKKSKADKVILIACKKLYQWILDNGLLEICNTEIQTQDETLLDSYRKAIEKHKLDTVIRITGDCALTDYKQIDRLIDNYDGNYDNNLKSVPDGFDVEIMPKSVIIDADPFRCSDMVTYEKLNATDTYLCNRPAGNLKFCIDTAADFERVRKLYKEFYIDNPYFGIQEIKKYHQFGYIENFEKAKRYIPNGSGLESKRAEFFGLGYPVADYIPRIADYSFNGVGCNMLKKDKPYNVNMQSYNSTSELGLCEMLDEMHDGYNMFRFTRSGGEAMAVAVRIARAHSGRDKVLFNGYHGWHDWYLSANIDNPNGLDNHLRKLLKVAGVPKALKGTAEGFAYDDIENFKAKLTDDVGVVVIELARNDFMSKKTYSEIRELTRQKGIVLIVDEITTGFRFCNGGLHFDYCRRIEDRPDIVVYGKAIGNGYPFGAVVGKHYVMQSAKETFISSTYWTEQTGFEVVIDNLKRYENHNYSQLHNHAVDVKEFLTELLKDYCEFSNIPELFKYHFVCDDSQFFKEFWIMRMFEKGFLVSDCYYPNFINSENNSFEAFKRCAIEVKCEMDRRK